LKDVLKELAWRRNRDGGPVKCWWKDLTEKSKRLKKMQKIVAYYTSSRDSNYHYIQSCGAIDKHGVS